MALPVGPVSGPELPPPVRVLGRLLDASVQRTPEAPALVFRPGPAGGDVVRWDYGRLEREVASRVRLLRGSGVRTGDRVGVVATRRPALVPTLLALLRLGAAYVPLDPAGPVARWRTVLELADVRLVVGPLERLVDTGLPVDVRTVDWDSAPAPEAKATAAPPAHADPLSAAYVLFTSGSTGRPKGVAVTHDNVTARIASYLALTPDPCRYLLHSSMCFDGAVGGLYSTLARGGCLVLVADEIAGDPGLAAEVVRAERVTHLEPVPSWFAALLDTATDGDLDSVRVVILGGEVLPPELVAAARRAVPGCRLFNDYGPTETTVAATAFEVPPDWAGTVVPIGWPHANTTVVLLLEDGRPAPAGAVGEIVVEGPCVSAGYVGVTDDPSFRVDPATGRRSYRTGDLARWSREGLVFVGRRDRQVKVRGQRVEPHELEAALRSLPGVGAAAVEVRRPAGEPELVAYVTAAGGSALTVERTMQSLVERVPPSLLPAALVVLPSMPLTAGGKIDRRALPAAQLQPTAAAAPAATGDRVEQAVLDAFTAVLDRQVQLSDDFFSCGGQSLAAARVAARLRRRLGVDVAVSDLFRTPAAVALAAVLRDRPQTSTRPSSARRGRPVDQVWRVAASPRQQSFWYLESTSGGRAASNLVECLELPDDVPHHLIAACAQALVDRHAALRTGFELTVDGLVQVVRPVTTVRPPVVELGRAGTLEQALRVADDFGAVPFDMSGPSLLRTGRMESDDRSFLVLVVHHAVCDGWSLNVLLEELVSLLDAGTGGAVTCLPHPPVEHVDVVEDLADRAASVAADAAVRHGLARLREASATAERLLPYDRPATVGQDVSAGVVVGEVTGQVLAAAQALAGELGATTYHVLSASLGVLLARGADVERVVLGAPVAGRGEPELDRVVGCLINTGLVRVDVAGDPTFRDVVHRLVHDAAVDEQHAWLPLELPLRGLAEGERAGAVPVLLNSLDLPAPGMSLRAGSVVRHSRPSTMAYTDLDLYLEPVEDGLRIVAVHSLARLDASTVEVLLNRWSGLLSAALDDPLGRISALPVLTADEEARLDGLEGTDLREEMPDQDAGSCGAPDSVLVRFLRHLREAPERPAVVDRTGAWTRRELWDRSGVLARLLAAQGAVAGDRIVIAVDGTVDAVASLLACWRLGAAAVPVGDTLPPARLAAVVSSCAARAVVDAGMLDGAVAWGPGTASDPGTAAEVAAVPDVAERTAYVIHTSGSTGTPKGVVVGHQALLASTLARTDAYPHRPETALIAHDLAFDAALGIVSWYLATGGRLVMTSRHERLDPEALADLVGSHGVGQLDIVPSHYRLLLDCSDPSLLRSLELVTLGGEACPPSLVRTHLAVLPSTLLVNEYGPTESTVWALAHTVVPEDQHALRVPVGRPVRGVVARIADSGGRRIPFERDGELLLSGGLLADGYLGPPQETAQRFVHVDDRRWYRTGDRARWSATGEVDLLGRVDEQLALRGFRIEPEGVEAVICGLPAVVRAAVGLREVVPGAPVLVAWVQPAASTAEPALTVDQVRDRCSQQLPEWSCPSIVVLVDELPETTSGKVDRARLPTPDDGGRSPERPPVGDVETWLAALWERLLDRPVVDAELSFFAMGGQSLLAARMVAQVRQELNVTFGLAEFLLAPDLRSAARLLESVGAQPAQQDASAAGQGTDPAQPSTVGAQQAGALLERLGDLSDDEIAQLLDRMGEG